jgi:hypothetical protein
LTKAFRSVTRHHTLEPRGRIERAGGMITTMARTALIDADLPPSLWPYAEAWAVKILNILPTTANQNNETPHSKMARLLGLHKDLIDPFLSHIRVFGAIAWLLLKGPQAPAQGDKTAQRAVKGRYLGAASRKGHVVYVWVPSIRRITTARDVTIVEKFMDKEDLSEEPEYAQWESDDDADDDLIQIKRRCRTRHKEHDTIEQVTEVSLQDIEQHEEDALFSTPPITPLVKRAAATATQPSQSTGSQALIRNLMLTLTASSQT